MKFKTVWCWAAALGMLWSIQTFAGTENDAKKAAGATPSTETVSAPSAVIVSDRYEFTNAVEGVELSHDFVIQNKGTEPLNIENVKTG